MPLGERGTAQKVSGSERALQLPIHTSAAALTVAASAGESIFTMLEHCIHCLAVYFAIRFLSAVQVLDATVWDNVHMSDSVKALLRACDIDAATARRMEQLLG